MKNLVFAFLTVFLFSAAPAMMAQSKEFFGFFGGQQSVARPRVADGVSNGNNNEGSVATPAKVREEDYDDFRDLAREEIRQTFADKNFTVVETEEESATFTVEVKIFSRERVGSYSDRYYQYSYHREPETILFVTVRDRASGAVVVVGEGKNKNLHRAIEKAAGSAADKLKKKKADRTIFLH